MPPLRSTNDDMSDPNDDSEIEEVPVASPKRALEHLIAHSVVDIASAKKMRAGFKLYPIVSAPPGPNGDALFKILVDDILHKGSRAFCGALLPYEPEKSASAIVSVQSGLGDIASTWGLELEGVTIPTSDDCLNPLMNELTCW